MKKNQGVFKQYLRLMLDRGFDCSKYSYSGCAVSGVQVRCAQCEVVIINGVPCHGRSCPNQTKFCIECGGLMPAIPARRKVCTTCQSLEEA